jgi:hypothetical protein
MNVQAEIFRRAVAAARVVCDARAYLPQLACGRLVSGGETATVSTTDLETWVDVVFPASGVLGPCLLELAPLAKRVPTRGRVALDFDGAEYWVVDGPRRLRLPSVGVDAWPDTRPDMLDATHVIHYDGGALLGALEHAERAVSEDPSRPFLHSVLLDDAGRVVATDGHRAHWTEGLPVAPGWRLPGAMVRAALGVAKHGKSVGPATLSGHGPPTSADGVSRLGLRLCFALDDLQVSISARERVEAFPPWERAVELVVPETPQITTLDGPTLAEELRALARAGLDDGEVRLHADGERLHVELMAGGALEARTLVPATGAMDVTAVQPGYLREILAQVTGAVTVKRGPGANQPLLFDLGEGRHGLLMAVAT